MNGLARYDSIESTGERIERHLHLVKKIAYHLSSKLPDSVQVEDLVQSGVLGLIEAARNYDGSRGAGFETYAGIRIRGAMLDEIRRSDWAPRSVHKHARRIARAIQEVESRTGASACDREVAGLLGVGLEEYRRMLQDAHSCRIFSLEELALGETISDNRAPHVSEPLQSLSREGFSKALAEAIESLPERERLAISLYYGDELNLREIGEVLGVGESRVSQICTQATLRLRARLAGWLEGNHDEF
ncbi:MAG: RNA polymerase sigma factor FliA [Gammaproteobacteria bacterium]